MRRNRQHWGRGMAFLKFAWRNALWISVVVFGGAAAALAFLILGLCGLGKKNEIVSLPLVERQEVEFPAAGRVVLCVEGPFLTTRFGGLDYELIAPDGTPVRSRAVWLRTKSQGISRVRLAVHSFDIPEPGRYVLRVEGLKGAQAADSEHRLVFSWPYLLQMVLHILGIVLAGVLLIGSVVLFGLRLAFGARERSESIRA